MATLVVEPANRIEVQRKLEEERASLPGLAVHPDGSIHGLQQPLRQGKAQPCPFDLCLFGPETVERAEQVLHLLRAYPVSGIANADPDPIVVALIARERHGATIAVELDR